MSNTDVDALSNLLNASMQHGRVLITEKITKELIKWHRRLCHPSTERLRETVKTTTGTDLDPKDVQFLPCYACDQAKTMKHASREPQRRADYPGEILWCDLGEMKPISMKNHRYFTLIIDDDSRYRSFKAHKTKDEARDTLIDYLKDIRGSLKMQTLRPGETTYRKIRIVRIDGGREFGMGHLTAFCSDEGIRLITSSPMNQYQNGTAERSIQFLQTEARASVIQSKMPSCFWHRILEATTYVINRTGQSTVKGVTPYEKYWDGLRPGHNHKPELSNLRMLGTRCAVLIDPSMRVTAEKLEARGANAMLLGYEGESNYLVWLLDGGRELVTPHATFHENLGDIDQAPDPREVVRSLPPEVQRRLRRRNRKKNQTKIRNKDLNTVDEDLTDGEEKPKRNISKMSLDQPLALTCEAPADHLEVIAASNEALTHEGGDEGDSSDSEGEETFTTHMARELALSAKRIEAIQVRDYQTDQEVRLSLHHDYLESLLRAFAAVLNVTPDQPAIKEALEGPEREEWLKAAFKEIRENLERGTFKFVWRSEATHGHLVDGKWVLRKKYLSTGELEKFKARICARGFTQRKGVDYNETTATTARAASWRILMALAAIKRWYVIHIDFVAAYLNGTLSERIFMKQFRLLLEYFRTFPNEIERYEWAEKKIIELMNPLYGLKQSGHEWQRKARAILAILGFKPLQSDDAVYYHKGAGEYIATHVDDFLVFGSDFGKLGQLANDIQNQVPASDLGHADWFLSVRIVRDSPNGDVRLDQQQYIEKALESSGFSTAKAASTPMDSKALEHAVKHEGQASADEAFQYASLLGKMSFPAWITRPDISFTASTWARFMANPSPEHMTGVKRLARYLQGTKDTCIQYRRLSEGHPHLAYNELGLFAAVDASLASDLEGAKSVTGYVVFMGGGPVLWHAKLQSVVARNSSESEYISMAEIAGDLAWIRAFLEEIDQMPPEPITLLCDNTGAIAWSKNTAMNKQKRHIRIAFHYVRQEVLAGHIKPVYVKSEENPADGLTKNLDRGKHNTFRDLIGLECVA